MTYESQGILSQGGSNRHPQEAAGFKTIDPRSPRRPGTKARRFTSIEVGDRFGRLTAVAPTSQKMGTHKCWIFRCDCGWEGPKEIYETRTQRGTCGRKCPFQLIDYRRNPNGWGTKTRHGYVDVRIGNKSKKEHRLVWERAYGPIPDGMEIHHIDLNRSNNALSNLQLVTPLEHRRIHAGWRLVGSVWHKPCIRCLKIKADTEFYKKRGNFQGKCRECIRELGRINWPIKKARRLKRREPTTKCTE